jgi:hypothetical protein
MKNILPIIQFTYTINMKRLFTISLCLCLYLAGHSQVTQSVHVTTAGTLSTLADAYLTTVTNLIVTGNIDAQDFKTMRDSMTNLVFLDISSVEITAYDGPNGTVDYSTSYPANELPRQSFSNMHGDPFATYAQFTNIILPNSITTLSAGHMGPEGPFEGLSSLTSVTIGTNTQSISEDPFAMDLFRSCVSLIEINVQPDNQQYLSIDGVIYDRNVTEIVLFPNGRTNYDMPATVITVPQNVFERCEKMTEFTVQTGNGNFSAIDGILYDKNQTALIRYPAKKVGDYTTLNTVKIISDNAFAYSSVVDNITIGPSVTSIGSYAFNWSGATSITIGDSVTIIGMQAFHVCSNLETVKIGKAVTYIDWFNFFICSSLKSIYAYPTIPPTLGAAVFSGSPISTCKLYVHNESIAAYEAAGLWTDFDIEALNITLSATTAYIAADANSVASLDITAYSDWTALSDQSWLTVSPESGTTGNYPLSFTAEANTENPRSAIVSISDGTVAQIITVVQFGIASVSTQAVSESDTLTAIGHGTISNLGYPFPTQYGTVWSTDPNPTVDLESKTALGAGSAIGDFSSSMSNLEPNTLYYAKSYATNEVGTAYGNEVTFLTPIYDLIVTAVTDSRAYNGNTSSSAVPLVGTLASGHLINDVPTQVFDNSDVGTSHVLTASNLTIKNSSNEDVTEDYNISYIQSPATGTITKADLTVTANDTIKTYGDANPPLTLAYSGFEGSDTETSLIVVPTATTSATEFSYATTYDIVPDGGEATNYNFVYVNGSLIINKAPLNVTANDTIKTYGDVNPPLTLAYSGFEGSDTETSLIVVPTATTSATEFSDATTYDIVPDGGEATNYNFVYVNGSLIINKAPLNVTADDTSRNTGEVNPEFTLSYTGFKGDDGVSVIDVLPTATTTADALSIAADYDIVPAGGSDNNYDLILHNGVLSISQATEISSTNTVEIRIYPNPSVDYVYIENIPEKTAIRIYNVQGLLVKNIISTQATEKINLNGLAEGMYLIHLSGKNIESTTHFMKQK